MITIFDMRSPNIKACRVRWWAPVNQWQELPGCKATLPVAVRAFRSGPWQGLHEVAAHCAFWQLGRSTLEDICGILGIDVVAGTDLVGLLWTMIQRVTGLPDQGVLEILHQRLANLDISNSYAPEVLCLDEALDVLEESDKRVALEEQRSVPSKVEAHKSFKRSYFAKAKVVRQSAAKAEGRPRKRAKKKQLFRETFEDSFDISQKDAKKFLPPEHASVWRSVTGRQGWNGHFRGLARISCAFGDGATSCRGALANVLVRLWDAYLTKNGLEWDSCPFDFDLDAA